MTLLEIVRHDKNDQHTIDTIQKIGSMIGKTTILVNDVPGFATSRLGVVLGNELFVCSQKEWHLHLTLTPP